MTSEKNRAQNHCLLVTDGKAELEREFQRGGGDGGKMYKAYFPCFMMLSGIVTVNTSLRDN